jgi:peptidoglycan/LPS O-acetylase OafA/YrhL
MDTPRGITTPPRGSNLKADQRSVSLDLIRVAAAFSVLAHHWFAGNVGGFYSKLRTPYPLEWVPAGVSEVLKSGYLGVDVFFVLSGVVIAKSALNKRWDVFVSARFLRLWPTYALAILVAIPIAAYMVTEVVPANTTLWSLTGFQWLFGYPTPVGPAWTLFLEIHFYAVIAVALRIFGPLNLIKLRSLLAAWLSFLLIAPNLHLDWFNFLVDSEFGVYFVFGAILGTANFESLATFRVGLPFLCVAGIAALVRFQARASLQIPAWAALAAAFAVLGAMTFVVALSSRTTPKTKTFVPNRLRPYIVSLGLMTYPIYLFHEELGMLLISQLAPTVGSGWAMALTLGFLLVFCLALVRFFEPWARKALRKLFALPV